MPDKSFVVVEIQTMADGTVATLATSYADANQAESAYHSVLAAAALSQLPRHAASLLTSEGYLQEARCYTHGGE